MRRGTRVRHPSKRVADVSQVQGYCSLHHDHPGVSYCCEHRLILCSDCVASDHADHKRSPLSVTLREARGRGANFRGRVSDLRDAHQRRLEGVLGAARGGRSSLAEAVKMLGEARDRAVERVQRIYESSVSEVEGAWGREHGRLRRLQQRETTAIDQLTVANDLHDTMLRTLDAGEMLGLVEDLGRIIHDCADVDTSSIEPMSFSPPPLDFFQDETVARQQEALEAWQARDLMVSDRLAAAEALAYSWSAGHRSFDHATRCRQRAAVCRLTEDDDDATSGPLLALPSSWLDQFGDYVGLSLGDSERLSQESPDSPGGSSDFQSSEGRNVPQVPETFITLDSEFLEEGTLRSVTDEQLKAHQPASLHENQALSAEHKINRNSSPPNDTPQEQRIITHQMDTSINLPQSSSEHHLPSCLSQTIDITKHRPLAYPTTCTCVPEVTQPPEEDVSVSPGPISVRGVERGEEEFMVGSQELWRWLTLWHGLMPGQQPLVAVHNQASQDWDPIPHTIIVHFCPLIRLICHPEVTSEVDNATHPHDVTGSGVTRGDDVTCTLEGETSELVTKMIKGEGREVPVSRLLSLQALKSLVTRLFANTSPNHTQLSTDGEHLSPRYMSPDNGYLSPDDDQLSPKDRNGRAQEKGDTIQPDHISFSCPSDGEETEEEGARSDEDTVFDCGLPCDRKPVLLGPDLAPLVDRLGKAEEAVWWWSRLTDGDTVYILH